MTVSRGIPAVSCRRGRALAPAVLCALAWGPPAGASPPARANRATDMAAGQGAPGDAGTISTLQKSDTLLGDLFGLRSALAFYGVSVSIDETSEVQGNPVGGARRGADYDGLTTATVQLETERALGWRGGLFNASALQIHGRNLSSDTLLNLQTSSGIQSDRATRLWELWYEQTIGAARQFSVRIGQQSLDETFMVNENGAVFLNTMFGWPLVPSVDLPGGGPAYPLAALGVQARYQFAPAFTLLAGVFNGSPASPVGGDAQRVNGSGTQFPTGNRRLYIAELQYAYPAVGAMVYPGDGAPLGHTYKIGAWYDAEAFDDQRFDTRGVPLAAADSTGDPRRHRGDYSIYAIAEQMVWREALNPNRSVSLFARAMGTPQVDRNLVDASLNAGGVLHEPIDNRADDTLAIGMGFGHVSSAAAGADRDAAAASAPFPPGLPSSDLSSSGRFFPVRGSETFVEATYQYQIHPWWQIQPDIQYVFNPGGGIADPLRPDQRVGNELVLGLRTSISF